jgi:hypothetical protein
MTKENTPLREYWRLEKQKQREQKQKLQQQKTGLINHD